MTAAQDKLSHAHRITGANALVASGVLESGFENVLWADVIKLTSSNYCIRRCYFGETAPGSTYANVVNEGDEYLQLSISGGAATAVRKYVYAADAWQQYAGENGIFIGEFTLTSAQVIALKATPVVLAPAPGANLAVVPVAVNLVANYGGTNAWTVSSDDLSFGYTSGAEIAEFETAGFLDQVVDEWRYMTFAHAESFVPEENTGFEITALDDEIGGNAEGDNTLHVKLWYRVVPTDA